MKKKARSFLMLRVAPALVHLFLSALRLTLRVEHVNRPSADQWGSNVNYIVCFWHARLLMMPFAKEGGGGKVLISRHRDGEFIARIVRYFNIGTVRGSYRKGSVSSLREILGNLRENIDIAITPDGPKGPRHVVKKGIVELSRLSGKALLPVSYGASKKKTFHSWDRFVLPLPFSKVVFCWGDPMHIGAELTQEELEEKRIELERKLVGLTEEAEGRACGK